jgi:hypothetical protein
MGEAKRRKKLDQNFGKSGHSKHSKLPHKPSSKTTPSKKMKTDPEIQDVEAIARFNYEMSLHFHNRENENLIRGTDFNPLYAVTSKKKYQQVLDAGNNLSYDCKFSSKELVALINLLACQEFFVQNAKSQERDPFEYVITLVAQCTNSLPNLVSVPDDKLIVSSIDLATEKTEVSFLDIQEYLAIDPEDEHLIQSEGKNCIFRFISEKNIYKGDLHASYAMKYIHSDIIKSSVAFVKQENKLANRFPYAVVSIDRKPFEVLYSELTPNSIFDIIRTHSDIPPGISHSRFKDGIRNILDGVKKNQRDNGLINFHYDTREKEFGCVGIPSLEYQKMYLVHYVYPKHEMEERNKKERNANSVDFFEDDIM